MIRTLAALLLILMTAGPAHAVNPDEILADPALEARAREIGKELRCLVCQNQSIDDSDADLARDLRVLVRERLTEGDSNQQVIDYVVSRYGDFVLLRPPVKSTTYLLWYGPAIILVLGILAIFLFYRRRTASSSGPAPLSDAEKVRLDALMKDDAP
jgi:cytochrome c-type biogenesis protein CcmH